MFVFNHIHIIYMESLFCEINYEGNIGKREYSNNRSIFDRPFIIFFRYEDTTNLEFIVLVTRMDV